LRKSWRIGYTLLRRHPDHRGGRPAERELVNIDLVERLGAWGKRLGLVGLEKLKAGLDQAYRLATRNVNQQLGLDSVALEVLAGFEPVPAGPDPGGSGLGAGPQDRALIQIAGRRVVVLG